MSLRLLILVLPLVSLILSACEEKVSDYKSTVYVFGTLVEFIIRDADPALAEKTVTKIDQDFQRMHKDWHAWKPGGELQALNVALSEGRVFEVSDFTLPLIRDAIRYEQLSNGLFNPAIGKVIDAWGFHADEMPTGRLPDFDEIKALAAKQPSMSDLNFAGHLVSSPNKAVSLDFGGFAKGVALDHAVKVLKDAGITNAIVNAGGDLNTLGSHGDRPWRVAIKHPVKWGVIAGLDLGDDENLYTSGNYQRFREHEGVRYAHIIDPRTGMPVDHIVSASVIHENGGLADAAATALTVAGPEGWYEVAKSFGVDLVLLVDAEGTIHMTPKMAKRVSFPDDKKPTIVVSDPL